MIALGPGDRVVLATRNRHKITEVARILGDHLPELVVLGLDAVAADLPEVAETGATFVENALLKAHAVATATGLVALADDSGLCVDALDGMPGVRSARWAGSHGDDAANLALVLAQTEHVPAGARGARFVCAAVCVAPDGREVVAEGTLRGTLTRAPRGQNGFGYDPIFVPEGERRTTAEMAPAEKDRISHRGRAFRALADRLH